ncbi:hypothetical protein [Arthrobacter sp. BF1]|uniref:GAP1-N2 domain-containing protein n=1 Tax=Arthrobacter sp. BF1 TaxID=2821145 RepID=UPI001C4FAE8E|nr:hypothetical protein [Arthrobacter sp. BF1]
MSWDWRPEGILRGGCSVDADHYVPERAAPAVRVPAPVVQSAQLPRWGQLSYASFDPGHGARGGWQAKEQSGELLEQELAVLQSRIVTQFDPVTPASDFPGLAEIAAMPRRFTYIRSELGQAHYWHSVMAGMDTTGRPGNVFSHVLVDREPSAKKPAFRPIQWWDSPDLLRPFGMDQVMAAQLPVFSGGAFVPGLDAQSVQDFLFTPGAWRAGLLAVLLDAVAAAMAGGPGVVLVVDSVESGAQWTAAVSFLSSPHYAHQLNFSLFERAGSLQTVFARGVHLVCVPRADAPLLATEAELMILDESETPNMGDVGGQPHTTAAGSRIKATYWGTLAQDAVASRETAQEAMAELDFISARLGDTGDDPEWPLALTAIRKPHIFSDAAAEAIVVLKQSAPESLRQDPELLGETLHAINASGSVHAEDAWKELFNGKSSPLVRETLVQTYLERALTDVQWLERPGSVELPEDYRADANTPTLQVLAHEAVLRLRTRLAERSSREAVLTAPSVLDFVASCELVDLKADAHSELADATEEILERVVGAVIDFDDEAQALVEANGPLRCAVVREKLLECVARTGRFEQSPAGQRMPSVFREWLFPSVPRHAVAQELDRQTKTLDPMTVEVALWRCENGMGGQDGARVAAAIGLFGSYAGTQIPGQLAHAIFHNSPQWAGHELWAVESRRPFELRGDLFYSALLEEQWTPALSELSVLVRRRGLQDITPLEAELADLRRAAEELGIDQNSLAHSWTEGAPAAVQDMARMFLNTLDRALATWGRPLVSPSVTALMVVAAVIALGSQEPYGPWSDALKQQLSSVRAVGDPGIARALVRCVESQILTREDAEHLGRVALINQPKFPDRAGVSEAFMAGITVPMGSTAVPVLEVPLRTVLGADPQYDMDAGAKITLEFLQDRLYKEPFDSERQREKALNEREKLFRTWWRQICLSSGLFPAEPERPAILESFKSIKSALWKDR